MSGITQRFVAAAIGLVFIVAGVLKVLNPAAFAIDIQNYRIVPWTWGVLVALYLPWVEIICGVALLCRVLYRGALAITAGLLAGFIVAYGSTWPRGLDIDCGCFGHGMHSHWPVAIGDPVLLVIVILLLKADFRRLSPVIKRNGLSEQNGNT